MKKKGEFLEQTKRNIQRQKLFDKAKKARESKEDFYITLNNIRYKLRPLSLDNNELYDFSRYIVFVKGKHRIAEAPGCSDKRCWYTYISDEDEICFESYKIGWQRMKHVVVGRILEENKTY